MEKIIKTFRDLEFKRKFSDARYRARITFDNNYGISVTKNQTLKTYELEVLYNNEICNNVPGFPFVFTIIKELSGRLVTNFMKQIQKL